MLEDHPRLRGEKATGADSTSYSAGSPPLTRGKDGEIGDSTFAQRITPAYAGKSSALKLQTLGQKDHPRLRGEKVRSLPHGVDDTGSPPLTRGKELSKREIAKMVGITPAYAGKSPMEASKTMIR